MLSKKGDQHEPDGPTPDNGRERLKGYDPATVATFPQSVAVLPGIRPHIKHKVDSVRREELCPACEWVRELKRTISTPNFRRILRASRFTATF